MCNTSVTPPPFAYFRSAGKHFLVETEGASGSGDDGENMWNMMNKRSGDDYGNRMFMISNPLNYTAEHTTEWDGFWRRGDDYGNRMLIILTL